MWLIPVNLQNEAAHMWKQLQTYQMYRQDLASYKVRLRSRKVMHLWQKLVTSKRRQIINIKINPIVIIKAIKIERKPYSLVKSKLLAAWEAAFLSSLYSLLLFEIVTVCWTTWRMVGSRTKPKNKHLPLHFWLIWSFTADECCRGPRGILAFPVSRGRLRDKSLHAACWASGDKN